MSILFIGGEICAFVPSDSTTQEDPSDARYYNAGFVRCSLDCGQGSPSAYAESAAFSAPDEFYVRHDFARISAGADVATSLELVASGTAVFRVLAGLSTLQMQAKIGGVWTNVGSAVSYTGDFALQTLDLYIDGNSASGTAKLFLSGTLRETASSVNLSAVVGVTKVRCYGLNTASPIAVSQVIVADEPTIGMRLGTYVPSGAGATSDWVGDHTSIDEIIYADGDFIYSPTNGQVELCTGSGPALTGYVVRAVGVYARAKRGAGGPQNLQLALRTGGTTYFSSSKALDVGYGAIGNIWETNPDSTNDWLAAQITSLQFGVKAIT